MLHEIDKIGLTIALANAAEGGAIADPLTRITFAQALRGNSKKVPSTGIY
jgi:hypothetical protein